MGPRCFARAADRPHAPGREEADRGARPRRRAVRASAGSRQGGGGPGGGPRDPPHRAGAPHRAPRRVRGAEAVEEGRRDRRRDGRVGAAPPRQGAAPLRAGGRAPRAAARGRGGAGGAGLGAGGRPDARARPRRDHRRALAARRVARDRARIHEAGRRLRRARGRRAGVGALQEAGAGSARQVERRAGRARGLQRGGEAPPEGCRDARRPRRAPRGQGGSRRGGRRAGDRGEVRSCARRDAPPPLRAAPAGRLDGSRVAGGDGARGPRRGERRSRHAGESVSRRDAADRGARRRGLGDPPRAGGRTRSSKR